MARGAEIDPGLEAALAAGPLRRWAERAAPELAAEAAENAPPGRVWHTVGDDKVRPTHQEADGQAIPGNLKFVLQKPQAGPTVHGQAERAVHHAEGHHGGRTGNLARKVEEAGVELAEGPRDETLSPGNRYNCRCDAETVTGMVGATVHPDPVEVGPLGVSFEVATTFNRAAESEFGDGSSPGLRWMGRSLNSFAARVNAGGAT